MNKTRVLFAVFALTVGGSWEGNAQAPDNTKTNQRDRNPAEITADKQKSTDADLKMTAAIRKAIIADKSLSTYAHNVKIVTSNGIITLKGPVRSNGEMQLIIQKAATVSGRPDDVMNQMTVAP